MPMDSISFSEIAALLDVDAEFYCLQQPSFVMRSATRPFSIRALSFFGEQLADFTDTAALIGNLDLVICVDTVRIAHLGGALGAPTWLLVPANAELRRWLTMSAARTVPRRCVDAIDLAPPAASPAPSYDGIAAVRRRLFERGKGQKKPSSGR